MSFTTDFVLQALAARHVTTAGALPSLLSTVSNDSRTLARGALYVALVGERVDGHTFVADALARGAGAVLVARGAQLSGVEGAPLIVVDDTLLALHDLARAHLQRLSAHRVALTGSNGKTTTKELVAAALRASWGEEGVLATAGNLNNHIGLPLTALRATERHRAVVLEMGMNHAGEIATLAKIARPEVGLVTNIGTAHAGNLGGIEGVARAKGELFEALHAPACAIVNADDKRCLEQARRASGRILTFGFDKNAAVRIVDVREAEKSGLSLTLAHEGHEGRVHLPLDGRHNAQNAAGAVACALALGLPFGTSLAGLAHAHAPHGRLERLQATMGALVLDDSYNANPDSMEAGLEALADLAGQRRRIAVLGQMLELGDEAPALHREVGTHAAKHVALLFTCGALGVHYGEGARAAGFDPSKIVHVEDSATLAPLVAAAVHGDDALLVKGSRGARMEVVVDLLCGRERNR